MGNKTLRLMMSTAGSSFPITTAWSNRPLSPTQSGLFQCVFDAVPNTANLDGVFGLSQSAAAAYSDLACIVRFDDTGFLDVYNGTIGNYTAVTNVPYSAGNSYHFRIVGNISAKTFDVYVTPPSSSETLIASGYGFRAAATSLANLGGITSVGTVTVNNLSISTIAAPAPVVTPVNFSLSLPATAGQIVGTVTATGSPTSWAITAGNASGYFAISNAGIITVTSAGASGLTAGSYSLTVQATNASGSGTATIGVTGSSGDPWASLDGRANAPAGTPQFPTLLNGYPIASPPNARIRWPSTGSTQSPWMVAGVDYYVGHDTTVTLQSPTTLNGAFGGAITVSGFNVNVASSIPANSTIQNIDFGQNEGATNAYQLDVLSGVSGLTIKNCKFAVGLTNRNDMLHLANIGTQVINCKFNGNKIVTGFNNGAAIYGSGGINDFTALYCWFKDIAGDITDYGQNVIIKYSLYDNPGDFSVQGPDPHCDWLQMTDGTYNLTVQFNTVRSLPKPSSGQGFGFFSNTSGDFTISSVNCQYNTVITSGTAPNGQPNYIFQIAVNTLANRLSSPGGAGYLTGTAEISNNFIDPRGTWANDAQAKVFLADTSAGPIKPGAVLNYTNNINMTNGATLTQSQ